MNGIPCRRERVLIQRAEDQTVLLEVDSGTYFSLNDVGARVWELCDGEHSVDDIVSTICGEYNAAQMAVRPDVIELLEHLRAESLLVEV